MEKTGNTNTFFFNYSVGKRKILRGTAQFPRWQGRTTQTQARFGNTILNEKVLDSTVRSKVAKTNNTDKPLSADLGPRGR